MPDLIRLGQTIRDLREMRGWTQKHLAQKAGVHTSTIGEYERGENTPSLYNLASIAEAFDAMPSALLADAGL